MPSKTKKKQTRGTNWAEKAPKLLRANLANLDKKVKRGIALTASEVSILKAESHGPDSSSSDAPEYAKNQSRLADILEVSRKTVQRWAKHENAPKPRPNGSLSVSEWRAFLAKNDVLEADGIDHASEKARQTLLQNKKLEIQNKILAEEYVLAADVELDVAKLIDAAKSVLLSGPSSLAPQVVGVSIPEAETLLREWLHNALSKLQQNPLGKQEAPNA